VIGVEVLVGLYEFLASGVNVIVRLYAGLLALAFVDAGLVSSLLVDAVLNTLVDLGAPLVPLSEGIRVARVLLGFVGIGVAQRMSNPFAVFDDVSPRSTDLEPGDTLFHVPG